MSYATQQDMEDRFGIEEMVLLTDREGTGSFNQEVFAQAQLDGDAEIDSYIRPYYVLPLAVVPTNLKRIACDVYRYYLYGNQVPEFGQKRYDQAIATLKLVQAGKIDLNPDNNHQPPPDPQVHFQPAPRLGPSMDWKLRNF